jgi:hypothetical protein
MAQKQAGSEFLSVPQIRCRRVLDSDTPLRLKQDPEIQAASGWSDSRSL